MAAITGNSETGVRSGLSSSVAIIAPDEEGGRQVRACLCDAGGFETAMVRYDAGVPAALQELRSSLILLAIGENPAQGLGTCRQLRLASDLPIVVCSRNASERDIVRAFESGADDYLVLPIHPRELGARLRAVLRRSADWPTTQQEQRVLVAGEFEIHLDSQLAFRRGQPIDLTPIEFRLLESLMKRPGQLVTHSQLLAEVWGPQYVDSRNYLRLYIQYLRTKIEDNPHEPRALVNEWGVGYRIEPGEAGEMSTAPRAAA
jgi:two-component system KDP operon response regulator KdpE